MEHGCLVASRSVELIPEQDRDESFDVATNLVLAAADIHEDVSKRKCVADILSESMSGFLLVLDDQILGLSRVVERWRRGVVRRSDLLLEVLQAAISG
jgi:superfamily II RNA helicase